MKIIKIETFILTDKLTEMFFFSQWEYSERNICIVKITTDDGIVGWGEGYGPARIIQQGVKFLEPLLIGKNPLQNETLWYEMYRKTLDFARRGVLMASVSCIDIALWDIKGKAFGQPVNLLLGGKHRGQVRPYATGLYFSKSDSLAEKLADEALTYVDQGFKAIKMKVGLTIKEDFENVKKVREAIGDDMKLMVDANHAYSLREAVELCRLIEPFNISWFEEPVSPEFYKHYRELRERTTIPIAGGECEYLRFGFHQLLDNRSVDILQLDICACGGLTEAKRIATLASTYGIEVIPHTWGTGIAIHTALHFISNLEDLPGRLFTPDFYMEYDRTENAIREQLSSPAIELKNGMIDVPDRPGLGIEVDEDALCKFSQSKTENNYKYI
ncbi:MAG: mandelate racemase/muconate lactonizing enzyme family protein [Cyclobacteriaceae bacterium]